MVAAVVCYHMLIQKAMSIFLQDLSKEYKKDYSIIYVNGIMPDLHVHSKYHSAHSDL